MHSSWSLRGRPAHASSAIFFNSSAAFLSYRYSDPGLTFRLGWSFSNFFCSAVNLAAALSQGKRLAEYAAKLAA